MPATPALPAPPDTSRTRSARFLMRGVRSVGFGVLIALLLTGGFGTPFVPNLEEPGARMKKNLGL